MPCITCATSGCRKAAAAPRANARTLRRLWGAADIWVRAEVASHPECPADVLARAEQDTDPLIRWKVASNPAIGDEALMRLLTDTDERVRAAAVRNPALSGERLDQSGDPSAKVRSLFARRSLLSPELVARLAADSNVWVRRWIARNPEVSGALLERLAVDPEMEVRRSVTRNQACPAHLLPNELLGAVRRGDAAALDELGLAACIECGCCDHVCPSAIALTPRFVTARAAQRPPPGPGEDPS